MARPKSFRTLLREAKRSATRRAKRRGHTLGRFKPAPEGSKQHGVSWHAHCAQCWRGVVILPATGVFGGSALRERCVRAAVWAGE